MAKGRYPVHQQATSRWAIPCPASFNRREEDAGSVLLAVRASTLLVKGYGTPKTAFPSKTAAARFRAKCLTSAVRRHHGKRGGWRQVPPVLTVLSETRADGVVVKGLTVPPTDEAGPAMLLPILDDDSELWEAARLVFRFALLL